MVKIYIFKAFANRFLLTLKLTSCVKEQQNFYGQPSIKWTS